MNYTIIKKIPSLEAIIAAAPLSAQAAASIEQHQTEIKAILSGQDSRMLLIVGPCSAWPESAVLEYAQRLKKLSDQVSSSLKIVMRVYIQKPRTTKGWIGPVNQPNPFTYPDIEAGIKYARQMMVKVVEMGLPIADEALFTHNARGFLELLSWVAIGARSAEDQEHRIFASAINCPVGLKNPTHGSLEVGVNGIVAAQYPHVAVLNGYEVQTHGNDYAHLVLRGSKAGPNYSAVHLSEVKERMHQQKIKNPAVIVDVSHDNCLRDGKKDPLLQTQIVNEILTIIKDSSELKSLVKGFMIESYIKEGSQNLDKLSPESVDLEGLSITDPCLGWDKTEALILKLARELN